MGIERKIRSYLETYGNTRENDLISYGVQNSGRSAEKVKKIIDRLAIRGKIYRVVHNKLRPPEVYISLDEPLPPEAAIEREDVTEEVERILEEAASLAEHIDGKKHP